MNDSIGISVAQAILQREGEARLSTSSQRLDDAFVSGSNTPNGSKTGPLKRGGIPCGTVGEIVGPPGIGKTTLAYVEAQGLFTELQDYRSLLILSRMVAR
jgi:RecA/RadA recombinase